MAPLRAFLPLACAIGLLASATAACVAEDDDPPRGGRLGATGEPTVRLEILGKGIVPIARVIISNPRAGSLYVSRSWTYEVVRQADITDKDLLRSYDGTPLALAVVHCLPSAITSLTLPEDTVFRGGSSDRRIVVRAGKDWGHDHELDLRPAHALGQLVFIRLHLVQVASPVEEAVTPQRRDEPREFSSDWQRYQLPDVPELPLVRFGQDARKLTGEAQFARISAGATVFTATASSGDYPWTRVLTLAKGDPLAAAVPRLLLDGKTAHIVPDGEAFRFAVTGMEGSRIDVDATVVSVQPLR